MRKQSRCLELNKYGKVPAEVISHVQGELLFSIGRSLMDGAITPPTQITFSSKTVQWDAVIYADFDSTYIEGTPE